MALQNREASIAWGLAALALASGITESPPMFDGRSLSDGELNDLNDVVEIEVSASLIRLAQSILRIKHTLISPVSEEMER